MVANVKISELPLASTIADTDIFAISDQTGNPIVSKKIQFGTINDQIDMDRITEGTLAIANGGTNADTSVDGFDNLSPLTTKGDAIFYSGTSNDRLPVGPNGRVIISDSSSSLGVRWGIVPYPASYKSNLEVTYTSTTTLTVSAGSARDSSNVVNINLASPIVASIATTGVNGLDTGTVAASTKYFVFVIADSFDVSPVRTLISTSRLSPSLPVGYDRFRRVGSVRTNSTSTLMPWFTSGLGREVSINYSTARANTQVLTAGSSITWAPISLASFVPASARKVKLLVRLNTNGGNHQDAVRFRPTGSTVAVGNALNAYSPGAKTGAGSSAAIVVEVMTNSAQSIDYNVTDAGDILNLYVMGYEDNLE